MLFFLLWKTHVSGHVCLNPGCSLFAIEGPSSTTETSDDDEDAIAVDRQSVLAIPAKDLSRSPKVLKLEDVTSRQLAYVLATSVPFIHPSDLVHVGGEAAPCTEYITHAEFCVHSFITVKTRACLAAASFVRPPLCVECWAQEALLEATVLRYKKIKDKHAESDAVQQVSRLHVWLLQPDNRCFGSSPR